MLLFDWIAEARARDGVSDIHLRVPIEPGEPVGHVLFREHGQITKTIPDVPIKTFLQVQRALLGLVGRVPGETDYAIFDKQIELPLKDKKKLSGRLSMVPYNHEHGTVFYSSSIRLLNSMQEPKPISQVVAPADYERASNLLDVDSGLVVVSGPTGHGKTTLLSSLLSTLYIERPGRRLMTVEDPIEIRIQGAQHFAVNDKQKMTFGAILKSLLRQDPDIVLVGEIRDEEVANIAVNLGLTGQTVFATCHATYATTVPARLKRLGVHPDDLSITLRRSTSQRLLTGCCPMCSLKAPLHKVPGKAPRFYQLADRLKLFTADAMNLGNDGVYDGLEVRPNFKVPSLVIDQPVPNKECPKCLGKAVDRRLVIEELSWDNAAGIDLAKPETDWWGDAIKMAGLRPMWFRAGSVAAAPRDLRAIVL